LVTALRGDRYEALILTALGTGARQGELLALRWHDVDLEAGSLSIRRTMQADGTPAPPKTESSIGDITMPRFVAETLRAHRASQLRQRLATGPAWHDEDLIFTRKDGRPLSPTTVRGRYRVAIDVAGLPHRPFHSLRHAFATLQHEGGEDMRTTSKLLGHASISTTMDIYAHLSPKTQQRAAERMDRVVAG
jgi:integrase